MSVLSTLVAVLGAETLLPLAQRTVLSALQGKLVLLLYSHSSFLSKTNITEARSQSLLTRFDTQGLKLESKDLSRSRAPEQHHLDHSEAPEGSSPKQVSEMLWAAVALLAWASSPRSAFPTLKGWSLKCHLGVVAGDWAGLCVSPHPAVVGPVTPHASAEPRNTLCSYW